MGFENHRIRKSGWLMISLCAMLMSGCASGNPAVPQINLYECPEPEAYPKDPSLAELIYALNDTFMAWEACHSAVNAQKV